MSEAEEWPVYQGYLSLERGRSLPQGTRERYMAEVALRGWWHTFFDPCPKLLQGLCPPDGGDIFNRFLAWTDENKPSMGWSLHLHLLTWLLKEERYAAAMTDEMVQETLTAAASRWAIFNRGPAGGIVIGCQRLGEKVVAGFKVHTPERGRSVNVMRLSRAPQLDGFLAYFTVPGSRVETIGPWEPIPK